MRAQMLPPAPAFDALYAASRADLPAAGDAAVEAFRDGRFASFKREGLPGPRSEAWKYTSLTPFNQTEFGPPRATHLDPSFLQPYLLEGAVRLVFINGIFSADLSDVATFERGVRVAPISRAFTNGNAASLLAMLDDRDENRGLSALNAALTRDGLHIHVDRGIAAERTVQAIFVSTGAGAGPSLVNVRNVVEIEPGASFDLVETHLFAGTGETATNLLNRIVLGEGARLRHDRMQIGDVTGTFLGRSECDLAADARLVQSIATLGGNLVRNEIAARLTGRGAEALFNGLYLGRGQQHHDNTLEIEHAAPGCHSDQFYKGVLDERAHAVFAGKIMVHQIAQQTNAYQANNNLLLSPDAAIDTKPELEIFADDVKCSHGATAGDLDEDELFYLRSRGIPPAKARSLLTFAFTGQVLERFSLDPAREVVRREVLKWLADGDAALELI